MSIPTLEIADDFFQMAATQLEDVVVGCQQNEHLERETTLSSFATLPQAPEPNVWFVSFIRHCAVLVSLTLCSP